MSHFDLDSFLACPSLSLINSYRKDDLAQIATHFGLVYSKPILKKELKALVVGMLVELKLIKVTVPMESAVTEGGSLNEVAGGLPITGDPPTAGESAVLSGEEGESDERPRTPLTLPRYDPLSPTLSRSRSKREAQLKVRLARLQLESQEKVRQEG